jgi:glycosyltransferase involved in cell wall biosynthesis
MSERLTLCMIVRDEEVHLARCLESVKGLVDEIVVVDTGSRDETIAIARRYGAIIKEVPWQHDFAAARNEALNLATGDWVLSLDADEALSPESRAKVPALLANPHAEGYTVTIQNLTGETHSDAHEHELALAFRLWRNHSLYRFVGSIHEQILPVIHAVNPKAEVKHSGLIIIHDGYITETVTAKGKLNRNVSLLETALSRHPDNQFLRFCLAGEYYLRRRFREARPIFQSALSKTPADASWRPPLVKYYAATLGEVGNWPEAIALLEIEVPRYPDFTDLTYLVGMAYSHLGKHEKAISLFQACVTMGPAPCPPYWPVDPEMGACKAHAALGAACELVGRYGEAMAAYAEAAIAKREWLEPLKRLTALMAKRVDDAQMLRVLEAFFPGTSTKEIVMLASMLAHAGRYDQALRRLEPLAISARLDRGGLFAYAFCLAKTDRCDEALTICAEEWGGSGFEPQIQALAIYCRMMMDDAAPLHLPTDKEELRALYADLGSLLAGDPPARVSTFLRRLPGSKLLAKRMREGAGQK